MTTGTTGSRPRANVRYPVRNHVWQKAVVAATPVADGTWYTTGAKGAMYCAAETPAEVPTGDDSSLGSRGHGPSSFLGRRIVVRRAVRRSNGRRSRMTCRRTGLITRITTTFGHRPGLSAGLVSEIQQLGHESPTKRAMGDTLSVHPVVVDQLGPMFAEQ